MAQTVEEQYKKVEANLKDISDKLKAHAEQAQADVKAHKGMTEETRAKVDELLTTQGALKARLDTAEQMLASDRGGESAQVLSFGQHAVADEEFLAGLQALQSRKGSTSTSINAAITNISAPVAEKERVQGIVQPPEQRLFVRDLLNWGKTSSNSIEFVRESGFTNNANVVSENPSGGKPESEIALELDSVAVATIAHWVHASKQVLDDVSMLRAHIDGRLRYGLKLKEEAQLLKGSGVGLNIDGIYTQAQQALTMGVAPTSETAIDRLRIAMLQAQLAEYTADGIVLNPIDWATIELLKDSQNRYLLANPQALTTPTMWGLPVVSTTSMDKGEYLVGAFRMGAQGWDREEINVTVSTEDRDNFIKNMVTILCEERIGLTVYRPEAFVKGDFDIALSSGL